MVQLVVVIRFYHDPCDRLFRMFPEGHLRVLLSWFWLHARNVPLGCREAPSTAQASIGPASEKGPDLIPNTTPPGPLNSFAAALGTMHS